MKKWIRLGVFIAVAISLVLAFSGCNAVSDALGLTGTAKIAITDSPVDATNVAGVYIKVDSVEFHRSDMAKDEFEEMPGFEGPKTYNLMDLTNGNSDMVGDLTLTAGQYTQIRFILDMPEVGKQAPSTPGCYIEFTDGTTAPLFVPSGSKSGFKFTGSFNVPINGSVDITVDFDVRKSLVKRADGTYILKPTTMHRLVVNDQAGDIKGTITNYIPSATGDYLVIYAYTDGTWKDTEDDTPAVDETRFPNAVTSCKVYTDETTGDLMYKLSYLAAGVYDLAVAEYDSTGAYVATKGFVPDVKVESKTKTIENVDMGTILTVLP